MRSRPPDPAIKSRGPGPQTGILVPNAQAVQQDTDATACEDAAMTEARLNSEQRRALALLAGAGAGAGANGVTDTIMLAQGVTLVMLGVLVVKGLAIVRWKPEIGRASC